MIKKILLFFAALLLSASLVVTVCAAEESATPLQAEGSGLTEDAAARHTLFSRLFDYCSANKTELLGLAGDGFVLGLALFIKRRFDKKTAATHRTLDAVMGDTAGTARSQASLVGTVNEMIDSYNKMRELYEANQGAEEERSRLVGAVMVQNTALLEILSTVYLNNQNLPQGVKTMILTLMANCKRTLAEEDSLRAVSDSLKALLNCGENKTEVTDTGEG